MFMEKIEEKIKGKPPGFVPGHAISLAPENAITSINITTMLGKATEISMGLLFLLSKDGYRVERVEESMEISPVHAPYYALTIKQKEELEGKIKTILATLSSAIAELELLEHDLRKYKEFLDYFELMEIGKKEKDAEKIKRADQTFRSIFIDQVDVHTGPEIALKLITPKWPTVIVDFLRLTDEDVFPEKIAEKLKISLAEASILATKNKLYVEWRDMFRTTVQTRYERIRSLVEAKKRSIEEIKASAKPVLMRYKSIREIGETKEGRGILLRVSWLRPATQAVSIDISKVWAWKTFIPPELYRPTLEVKEKIKEKVLRMRKIPIEFKEWLIAEIGKEEAEKKEATLPPLDIEPLDRWAIYLIRELEKEYKIKFKAEEILELREKVIEDSMKFPSSPYFTVVELKTFRTVLRTPNGKEFEDITFDLKAKIETFNILLVRYAEILVKDKLIEGYISELLGEMAKGKTIGEIVKEEFPTLKEFAKKPEIKIKEIKPPFTLFEKLQKFIPLIRTGPYERVFDDRFAAFYLTETAARSFSPYVDFLKKSVGVP